MKTNSRMNVLEYPSIDDLLDLLRDAISKHRTIIMACSCEVNYEGRANSKLTQGERLIIIKSDGSVLIHRPKDYSPVNWQPTGSLFKTRKSNGTLLLCIYRRKDKEIMEINIIKPILFSSLDLKDSGEFNLFASEKDMQEAILYYPSLIEEGFRPIRAERPVDPGFIDIMGVDKNGILSIVEIKRVKASKESVLQLKKYIDVIDIDKQRKVRGILVAPKLSKGVQELLTSFGFEYKLILPQKCSEILKKKNNKQIIEFFK